MSSIFYERARRRRSSKSKQDSLDKLIQVGIAKQLADAAALVDSIEQLGRDIEEEQKLLTEQGAKVEQIEQEKKSVNDQLQELKRDLSQKEAHKLQLEHNRDLLVQNGIIGGSFRGFATSGQLATRQSILEDRNEYLQRNPELKIYLSNCIPDGLGRAERLERIKLELNKCLQEIRKRETAPVRPNLRSRRLKEKAEAEKSLAYLQAEMENEREKLKQQDLIDKSYFMLVRIVIGLLREWQIMIDPKQEVQENIDVLTCFIEAIYKNLQRYEKQKDFTPREITPKFPLENLQEYLENSIEIIGIVTDIENIQQEIDECEQEILELDDLVYAKSDALGKLTRRCVTALDMHADTALTLDGFKKEKEILEAQKQNLQDEHAKYIEAVLVVSNASAEHLDKGEVAACTAGEDASADIAAGESKKVSR